MLWSKPVFRSTVSADESPHCFRRMCTEIWISRCSKAIPDVLLSVDFCPTEVQVETPFDVHLRVSNNSARPLDVRLSMSQDRMHGLLPFGVSTKVIDTTTFALVCCTHKYALCSRLEQCCHGLKQQPIFSYCRFLWVHSNCLVSLFWCARLVLVTAWCCLTTSALTSWCRADTIKPQLAGRSRFIFCKPKSQIAHHTSKTGGSRHSWRLGLLDRDEWRPRRLDL